jgi:aspartyl-tRNA(Asn)/glutamyl-tRNA(Gln) amidotransferase subunit A
MGPHGYNAHLPPCRNPWAPEHVPCGSSSGCGVAVAARLVPAGLGSDTGGSVRCPASANGVVGLLPTYGRVSRHGVMPMSFSLDAVGPLARTAADCALLLQVIAGPDPLDPTCAVRDVPDYPTLLHGDLAGLRIGLPARPIGAPPSAEVATCLAAALDVLRGLGGEEVEITVPEAVDLAAALHPLVMKAEGAANHHDWMRRWPEKYSEEVRNRLQAGYFISASDYIQALKLRGPLLEAFAATVFGTADVLLTPVLPAAAPTIAACAGLRGTAYVEMVAALTGWTKWVNFFGLPAISVPCGFTPAGLPVSFQLVGRPFDEATLLRCAHRYQQATDWHTRLPPDAPTQ